MISLQAATKFTISILLAFAISGCQAGNESIGLDVVGYNHTDRDIGSYSVNGQGGSYIGKHSEGGDVCCVSIPRTYLSGASVVVRWGGEEIGRTKEKKVRMAPYTPADGGHLAVHFFPDGDIAVFVTMYYPENSNYPLKGEKSKF